MRKITLSRPQRILLPFIKGKILIDDNECGTVKAGKTEKFEIADGMHAVQVIFAALPPVNSNVLYIEDSDGDTEFEIKITVPFKSEPIYAELIKK